MSKYIDAGRLKELLDAKYKEFTEKAKKDCPLQYQYMADGLDIAEQFIDSLQQDETQVDKMLCSQVWWEKQGWIMIPPDATVEGIDSLLRQVKKKLQQEQPEKGLDVTEFCRPINPGIARCIADHWWEMLDGKDAEEKQPEVDLEKEYQEFCKDYPFPWSSQYVNREYIDELCLSIARHFYELGLKAKEDNK